MYKLFEQNLIILSVTGLILAGAFYVGHKGVAQIVRLPSLTNNGTMLNEGFLNNTPQVQPIIATITNLSVGGYAWSDNIGYISFGGDIVCVPASSLTQTLACPSGQIGLITQTRTSICPGPVTSGWATTSNTCVNGITWWPNTFGNMDWDVSVATCAALIPPSRLPTTDELIAALRNQFVNGGSTPGGFAPSTFYWSSSNGPTCYSGHCGGSFAAWFGYISDGFYKQPPSYVRCVH